MTQEPDPRLAAELRQSAGREWAEEAAEDERLTELLRQRQLGLGDVAKDLAHRGARVYIEFGGHNFTGPVLASGSDYALVRAPGQDVVVRLEVATWALLPEGAPIDRPLGMPETFKGHLQELAAGAERTGLALPGGDIPIGLIEVVATDHVALRDANDRLLYFPLDLVMATIRSVPVQ